MNSNRLLEPIDRIAITAMMIFGAIIVFLLWGGSFCGTECLFHNGARVSDFSWQNKSIGREDRAFLLTFNRPMDRSSVEQNLTIEPPLPGKISWSGLRLAYTLETPAPYGESYQVSLRNATDRFAAAKQTGEVMQPFVGEFRSRDRALVYIGSQGEERNRLVLFNWTQQQKKILTPENLIVFDFEPYPQSDKLLFSAASKDRGKDAVRSLQLYTVTTGLGDRDSQNFQPQIQLILDNKVYQNNKFDLSQDGKTIVVQRINRKKLSDIGLWAIAEAHPPQLLDNSPGGDFLITPDSQAVAVAKGEGIALLPLQPNAEPLDFLPQFGRVLSFTRDGTGAVMVDYNRSNAQLRYTRSLVYVNNQGLTKELLNTSGSIVDCKFDPTATNLYCLLTKLQKGEVYKEKPYLAHIDLKTATVNPLVQLPEYQDSKISIAPDGLGILFDRWQDSFASATTHNNYLWLLIIPPEQVSDPSQYHLEELPFMGFRPQWLP